MESAGPLMHSQLEDLGALSEQLITPSQVAGLSQLSTTVAVQLPIIVAN